MEWNFPYFVNKIPHVIHSKIVMVNGIQCLQGKLNNNFPSWPKFTLAVKRRCMCTLQFEKFKMAGTWPINEMDLILDVYFRILGSYQKRNVAMYYKTIDPHI